MKGISDLTLQYGLKKLPICTIHKNKEAIKDIDSKHRYHLLEANS